MNLNKGKLALPPHLQNKKHNDWPWPFSNLYRGYNAYGSRCPEGTNHCRIWPPRLVKGYGVARWETTGAESIIEIPALKFATVDASIYGKTVFAYERNEGNPNFNKLIQVKIKWERANVWDQKIGDKWVQRCLPNDYHPSALQKFSPKGWMKLNPEYHAWWRRLDEEKEEPALNFRRGFRPDSLDAYYNKNLIYAGLKYE